MKPTQTHETRFRVQGMDCDDEVKAVRAALLSLPGVKGVEPNIMSAQIRVLHDQSVSPPLIARRIESVGLKIREASGGEEKTSFSLSKRAALVVISGIFLVAGLILDWFSVGTIWFIRSFFLLSIGVGGALVVPKALRAAKSFRLDMTVLMTVATLGAIGIGEYAEASAVVFLFAWRERFPRGPLLAF